jgi:type I restriction enzyme S subunit
MELTVRPSITNQQINAVVPSKTALGEFIYYALANLTPWVKTIAASNTLPIINKTDSSKIAILHPTDKKDQHRIASCLSSLDALIAAEMQKHAALQRHKRGLMQQLFPSQDAQNTL